MKTCDEMVHSLLERREQYVAAQKKKKKVLVSTITSLCAVAMVGVAVWQMPHTPEQPPVTLGTTTAGQSETETTITTTENGTADTTTADSTIVTTTAPSKTQTTADKTDPTASKTDPPTTAKTEPSETTATTTAPKKTVIGATKPDNSGNSDAELLSNKRIYITPLLQQIMEAYEGYDVEFAVIVSIPVMQEDYYVDFWESSDELSQCYKEYYDVYYAFVEEAKSLNPSWDGVDEREIDVWTDTMRAKWEYWLTLIDKRKQLEEQYRGPYVESVLNQRFEALKAVCTEDPIDIFCGWAGYGMDMEYHAYYVELSAESINALAEKGGYTFRWASLNQTDYGYWDIDA